MLREWTVGRKLTLGFAVAVVAVILVGVVGYRATTRAVSAAEQVAHTHAVQAELAKLQLAVVNVETGVRGFVLTGDQEILRTAQTARESIAATFASVRVLTRDNPIQQGRWPELEKLLTERMRLLDDQIKGVGPQTNFDAARTLALAGRSVMLQIKDVIISADAEEERLLEIREAAAKDDTSNSRLMIIIGALVAGILSLVIGLWISLAVTKQVGSAVQQVQSSSAELQAAANQQASSSTQQSTAMNEIATTISELLATSRQIAESAQRVSQIASQTASAARAGDQTVSRANDASLAVRKQVDQVVNHMLDLGKRSQQIGGVLDMVSELAEQTNILAINASIEAAGAGESGRRFGVVADEIRKLADRVTASTKEIRVLIDDVRSAVNTTVMATETGSKAVDAGAAQVAETAASFKQIAGLVGTTTDAAREIELSTKQQATAVEQVNVAISNVAQAARETEASATQTLQTSVRLTELSSELMRITEAQRA